MLFKSLKKTEFGEAYHKGKKAYNGFFTLIYSPYSEFQYGIAVSKKHGSAVVRNKIKRRVKEALRSITKETEIKFRIVVIPKTEIIHLHLQEIKGELFRLIKKASIVS